MLARPLLGMLTIKLSSPLTKEVRDQASRMIRDSLMIDLVDWITENTRRTKHPLIRLHNEILDFCNYIAPSRAEISSREKAVEL